MPREFYFVVCLMIALMLAAVAFASHNKVSKQQDRCNDGVLVKGVVQYVCLKKEAVLR